MVLGSMDRIAGLADFSVRFQEDLLCSKAIEKGRSLGQAGGGGCDDNNGPRSD